MQRRLLVVATAAALASVVAVSAACERFAASPDPPADAAVDSAVAFDATGGSALDGAREGETLLNREDFENSTPTCGDEWSPSQAVAFSTLVQSSPTGHACRVCPRDPKQYFTLEFQIAQLSAAGSHYDIEASVSSDNADTLVGVGFYAPSFDVGTPTTGTTAIKGTKSVSPVEGTKLTAFIWGKVTADAGVGCFTVDDIRVTLRTD